jgi:2-polyprenyl-6-methoxyphenol hydroxylase-like FAD-dependent oxidoreductase
MEYQVLDNEFDVLVVGAGPVGLWVACELALAKVNVAVLERRAEPVTQSRGLAIQGRTLEVFALRGLADRFLSRGRPIPKAISAYSAMG